MGPYRPGPAVDGKIQTISQKGGQTREKEGVDVAFGVEEKRKKQVMRALPH